jgi:hypothetical protein
MSIEFPRFRDITEYSTNAINYYQLKSYRHPALRDTYRSRAVYGHWQYLIAKIANKNESNTLLNEKLQK